MQKKGLEPSPCCQDRHLKPARLPIPPLLQAIYLSQARHILTRGYGFVNRKIVFVTFRYLCKYIGNRRAFSRPLLRRPGMRFCSRRERQQSCFPAALAYDISPFPVPVFKPLYPYDIIKTKLGRKRIFSNVPAWQGFGFLLRRLTTLHEGAGGRGDADQRAA